MNIVLIDRDSRELSNGCHIVNICYFGPRMWKSSCRLDLQPADGFLTPFLNETIEQKSSNAANEYAQSIEQLKGFPKRHSSSSLAA